MKQKTALLLALISLVLLFVTVSSAVALDYLQSMRCSHRLVSIGTFKYEVRRLCGDPTIEEQMGYAKDVWVYDFGSTRLVHTLHFVQGELKSISTGRYGGD
jgi:hypothetical protein